jgi:hypothetical protein
MIICCRFGGTALHAVVGTEGRGQHFYRRDGCLLANVGRKAARGMPLQPVPKFDADIGVLFTVAPRSSMI